jgi:hypothetical protein
MVYQVVQVDVATRRHLIPALHFQGDFMPDVFISYSVKDERLARFMLVHPHLPLANNKAERALRHYSWRPASTSRVRSRRRWCRGGKSVAFVILYRWMSGLLTLRFIHPHAPSRRSPPFSFERTVLYWARSARALGKTTPD